ncbi:dsRBD fold-containing protein [Streptomyces niveus]|uniref:dsRBD fold-containing protein n=1 Tax=Streptomyces niveus TaxID=193462 RepID=UPI00362C3962
MTQQAAAVQGRTRTWNVRLDIFEEDKDTTAVYAVLDTGESELVIRTTAHRNPHDRPAPEIGDEYAAGRALRELGRRLLNAGATDAEDNTHR